MQRSYEKLRDTFAWTVALMLGGRSKKFISECPAPKLETLSTAFRILEQKTLAVCSGSRRVSPWYLEHVKHDLKN